MEPPRAAHAGKAHKRTGARKLGGVGNVGSVGKKNRAETDLDSPLNPYAR
jgi:hypothetical protein